MSDFQQNGPSYKPESTDTLPYVRAKQEWDNRLGSAHVQARNWRLGFVILACLLVLSSIANIMLIRMQKNTVFIAEVARSGHVVNVSPLMQRYTVTDAQYIYFIQQFLEETQSIPLDPVLFRQNWLKAYHFVSGMAISQLTDFVKNTNPMAAIGKETRTIQFHTAIRHSDNSFEARWTQNTYNPTGKLIHSTDYIGLFTLSSHAPTDQTDIMINPLGIHIQYFQIQSESHHA